MPTPTKQSILTVFAFRELPDPWGIFTKHRRCGECNFSVWADESYRFSTTKSSDTTRVEWTIASFVAWGSAVSIWGLKWYHIADTGKHLFIVKKKLLNCNKQLFSLLSELPNQPVIHVAWGVSSNTCCFGLGVTISCPHTKQFVHLSFSHLWLHRSGSFPTKSCSDMLILHYHSVISYQNYTSLSYSLHPEMYV